MPEDKGRDEHLGLRFWVQIDGVEIAGFSECSGISVETETTEYAEGGLNTFTHKLPVRTKYGNLTLKRGIDPGHELYTWYMSTLDGKTQRKDISVIIYGPKSGTEVRHWDLKKAYPVKWTGPDMRTDASAVAIESVEIAHEGFTPKGASVTN